jgi:hypothetical protein
MLADAMLLFLQVFIAAAAACHPLLLDNDQLVQGYTQAVARLS